MGWCGAAGRCEMQVGKKPSKAGGLVTLLGPEFNCCCCCCFHSLVQGSPRTVAGQAHASLHTQFVQALLLVLLQKVITTMKCWRLQLLL
jgi:hypothetical protein